MEPVVLILKEKIKVGSEEIAELRVRPPKAKDIRKMTTEPTIGELLDLGGRLCAQPTSVIDELSIEDTGKLLETVGNFIAPGP